MKAVRTKVDRLFFLISNEREYFGKFQGNCLLLVLHWLFQIHHVTENDATQCTWIA